MEQISSGLSMYAKFKSIGALLIITIILLLTSYYVYYVSKQDYRLGIGSKITRRVNQSAPDECKPGQTGCFFFAEYDDATKKHHIDQIPLNKKPVVGSTTIYYKNKTPEQYVISSIKPTYISGIILFVVLLIFIGTLIYMYIIFTNKDFAAVSGGVDIVSGLIPRTTPSPMFANPGYAPGYSQQPSLFPMGLPF